MPVRPGQLKKNVVPDRLDLRDRSYQPRVSEPPPPSLNSLVDGPLPIPLTSHDQGDTSACTGFALARVIDYLLIRSGRSHETPVSPYMLYSMARRYDEFPGYTADEGSSLRGALKGWYKHGACGYHLWKAMTMPRPAPMPDDDWWPDASRRTLGAYYRVDTRSVTDMHVALHEVGVLYASSVCHSGWDEGLDAPRGLTEWIIPQHDARDTDGGHAFAIVGYNRTGFLVLNSWGPGWGAGGFGVLTYEDWLDNAMDCWVAQLGVVTEQHKAVAEAPTLRIDGEKGARVLLAADRTLRDKELSAFIVDVGNNGILSDSGNFRTKREDLEALSTIHINEARRRWGLAFNDAIDVALYAHGGLVSEKAAADTAARWIPALYEARIFPVFLMWETDLWSTLKNRLADVVSGWAEARPRPTAGLRDQIERHLNRRIERTLAGPGSLLWDEMKQNARALSAHKGSAVRLLYSYGKTKRTFVPGRVRLHLIGHSAGAIVHSHVVQALSADGWRFASVTFMAPAVRCDVFRETVGRHLGGRVHAYHQYHLSDTVEQEDPTCRPLFLYGRSLLYLVSQSFEHGRSAPILGLEKDFSPFRSRRGVHEHVAPGRDSGSTTHGSFDDDDLTRRSVIASIHRTRA